MQVGQYVFTVTPPSNLPGEVVLGNSLSVKVKAALAEVDSSRCFANIWKTAGYQPFIGSYVIADVTLADWYGNPITAPAEGEYTNSRLTITREYLVYAELWFDAVNRMCDLL
jgi:hypothetical protein